MNFLDIVKQKVKIADLVAGDRIRVNNGFKYKTCPICGHGDHFVLWDSNNYCSFGCGSKGSIIDFLVNKENCSNKEATKKAVDLSGLESENLSFKEIREIKRKAQIEIDKLENEKVVVNKFYNAITKMFKACKAIDLRDRDAFLNWVLSFMDRYSNLIIVAKNHQERIRLVRQFKSYFNAEYKFNFLPLEDDLNRIVEGYKNEK